MLKKKNKPWIITALIVIVLGLFLLWGRLSRRPEMILFHSSSCPHCLIVEQYINDNNIRSKYQFRELEVSGNQENSNRLIATAKKCGLDTSRSVSIPLFFDGQKCFIGDEEIINFFKTK